jgi:hypothetical protein
MTDLELTERCAKWLGYRNCRVEASLAYAPQHIEIQDEGVWVWFNPLHDWNDLMTRVVPKLPMDYWIEIRPCDSEFIINYDDEYNYDKNKHMAKIIKEGKFPDDFPRAILELIAEMEEKKT